MQTDVVRTRGSTTELQDTMGKFTLINSIFNETEEKVVLQKLEPLRQQN